jgi:hypothetical protein
LPVLNDFQWRKYDDFKTLKMGKKYRIITLKSCYLRNVICIEAQNGQLLKQLFEEEYAKLQTKEGVEPMFNLIATFNDEVQRIGIFPRKAFRPTQFFEQDESNRLLFSPGTIEMSGVFVTSDESSYQRITKKDIVDIYSQISQFD